MTAQRYDTIKRGRMSPEEKAEINRLCETMTDPAPSKIALRLNRHPATVHWYMLRAGYWDKPPRRAPRPYQCANGQKRYPYSEEHDRRLLDLEIAGHKFRRIAEIMSSEFGIPRNEHSVRVRSIQLAAGGVE
jgi:IS30 family transposase